MARDGQEGGSVGVVNLLDGLAKVVFYAGAISFAIGLIVLMYTLLGGGEASPEAIARNAEMFSKFLLIGGIAGSLSAAYLFYGEETAGFLILIVGGALSLAQIWAPLIAGQSAEKMGSVVGALATGGYVPAVVGIVAICLEMSSRMRLRMQQGSKADQLKFGKGVKEERDRRNQFMGKCWQLPYCRKFVRERCPIYHARRTCWKERVGCMCEESVIRNAMEGKLIPSDLVAAAKYIPYNNKLTPNQKAERCKQCIIYNEHQKHKYQLLIPAALAIVVGAYVLLREPVGGAIKVALGQANGVITKITFTEDHPSGVAQRITDTSSTGVGGVIPYHEIIMVVLAFVAVAYAIKFVEFLIFKLKI
jgi:hypothetical protein